MLDALAPVWDASGGVPGVDDVALVACGAVKRLVSVLRGAAGFRWRTDEHNKLLLENTCRVI